MHKCAVLCSFCTKIGQNVQVRTERLFLQFRIRESGLVNGLEFLNEDGLGIGYVAESDGTLTEIAFGHLSVDETVDEFSDGLFCVVG